MNLFTQRVRSTHQNLTTSTAHHPPYNHLPTSCIFIGGQHEFYHRIYMREHSNIVDNNVFYGEEKIVALYFLMTAKNEVI